MKGSMLWWSGIALLAAVSAGPVLAHGGKHDGHDEPTAFARFMADYEAIRTTLLADSIDGVAKHAKAVARRASRLGRAFDPEEAGISDEHAKEAKSLLPRIESAAAELARAESLEQARERFGALSEAMIEYRGLATGKRPVVVQCPMVKRRWLQPKGEIGNPYLGQKMPKCGMIESK